MQLHVHGIIAGYYGIDQTECEDVRGCCWNPDTDPEEPWCFRNISTTKNCGPDSEMKIDCGYFGITEAECNEQGCCWEESQIDPWCFYPFVNCDVPDDEKRDCGYLGIHFMECRLRGCCWESSLDPTVPWCYSPAD